VLAAEQDQARAAAETLDGEINGHNKTVGPSSRDARAHRPVVYGFPCNLPRRLKTVVASP